MANTNRTTVRQVKQGRSRKPARISVMAPLVLITDEALSSSSESPVKDDGVAPSTTPRKLYLGQGEPAQLRVGPPPYEVLFRGTT